MPLIHALGASSPRRGRLLSILQQRKREITLSDEILKLALEDIKTAGGLQHAKSVLLEMQVSMEKMISLYEIKMDSKNWIMRLSQKRLEIEADS